MPRWLGPSPQPVLRSHVVACLCRTTERGEPTEIGGAVSRWRSDVGRGEDLPAAGDVYPLSTLYGVQRVGRWVSEWYRRSIAHHRSRGRGPQLGDDHR